jgi:hypothetical protein
MVHVTDGAKLHLAATRTVTVRGHVAGLIVLTALAAAACGGPAGDPGGAATTPVYDPGTGRLERLESDQDGDGVVDAVAFMDGVHIKYVEIDRDHDGRPDRWEYYVPNPAGEPGPGSPDGRNLLERAEEGAAQGEGTTRREIYERGLIARVEEDSDGDGRMDKWEFYEAGELRRVDLDLAGRGTPDRRLTYTDAGVVIEADPDGDGLFTPVKAGGGG